MTARMLGIVVAVACSVSGMAEAKTNLKPFDPVALQAVVEATGKELLLPGAMVLLRTPQGDLAFGYGTELGGTASPREAPAIKPAMRMPGEAKARPTPSPASRGRHGR